MRPASRPPPTPSPIRDAVPGDLPALVDLETACFGDGAWSAAQLAAELAEPSAGVVVAPAAPRRAVGYAVVRTAADEGELLRIAVEPASRRRGIAGELLGAALERLGRHGARRCFLEVRAGNRPAIRLYERHGFHRLGRRPRYYPGGEDALLYVCAVSGPG